MATSNTNQNSTDVFLRDLLECPVCMETIKSVPVYQCTNGHVMCKDCIEKLNNCPICRNDSTLSRNLMIEQIIEKFDEIQPENKGLIKKPELQIWGNISTVAYSPNNDSDASMMSDNDDNHRNDYEDIENPFRMPIVVSKSNKELGRECLIKTSVVVIILIMFIGVMLFCTLVFKNIPFLRIT